MNNLTLYEISNNYVQALDFLTDPELDLPMEAINDTLEGLSGEFEEKAVNVAMFLRNMETTAEAIKVAEETMAKRRKALESRAAWLKGYLKANMERSGITRIDCPFFKLAVQKNGGAVNITDEDAIPEQYKEAVITWKIGKTAIKAAIKAGETVPGAEFVSGTHLVIK